MKSIFKSKPLAVLLFSITLLTACGQVPLDYFSRRTGMSGTAIILDANSAVGAWTSNCYVYTDLSHSYPSAYAIDQTSFTDISNRYTATVVYSDPQCTHSLYTYTIHSIYAITGSGTRLNEQLYDLSNVMAYTADAAAKLSRVNYCSVSSWPVNYTVAVSSPTVCSFPGSRSSTLSATSDNGSKYFTVQNSSMNTIVYHNAR